ncbi:MAG: (2Fe-2S)-binding protein [Candidatus Brocadiae bacterium]|nr:(2Fe-2S)-binding protein [Candidatus Brocadiia bacterium]
MAKKDPVCFCFEVYKEELVEIIKKHKTKTVEEIQKYCQASMGCGSCRSDIEQIIEDELGKS